MTRARTDAIRSGHRVSLCKSGDQQQCADTGTWEGGFVVFVDVNQNGRIDEGEPVLGIDGHAPRGITIAANRPLDDYVSYMSVGHARMLKRRAPDGHVHGVPARPARDARRARRERARAHGAHEHHLPVRPAAGARRRRGSDGRLPVPPWHG
jgi:hypothetical protein